MNTNIMKISSLLGLVLSGLLFALEEKPAAEAPPAQPKVVAGNTEFAWDLYRQLVGLPEPKKAAGNLFFSPYSISTALAMTYAGARGQTEAQMRDTLRFFDPQADFHAEFGRLEQILNKQGLKGDYQLAVANALWMQKDFSFLEAFLHLARDQYSAKLETVDFKIDAEGVRQIINTWVESKTNDRIKDLIPAGMLDAATRLVLTNAIYFKGDWAEKFDKERTQDDLFTVSTYTVEDGKPKIEYSKVQVPMMTRKDEFAYGENEICHLLQLPYRGGDLSMVILLPNEQDLFGLEQALTPENLKAWTDGLRKREVEVYLPRFTMTYECQLSQTLAAMGMPEAFSSMADFSGMTGGKDLFISDVIHKAFVEVNEEGTEAAAATGVAMKLTAMPLPPPVFRVDRPFVFAIMDNGTGSILFIGRVTDPTQQK
jgi:serine protease inhibitor